MTKLEPFYLAILVKYFDGIETLEKFNEIDKHCNEAMSTIKINPSYNSDSLETMLECSETKNVIKELKVFPNLDTLQCSFYVLNQLVNKNNELCLPPFLLPLMSLTFFSGKHKVNKNNRFYNDK